MLPDKAAGSPQCGMVAAHGPGTRRARDRRIIVDAAKNIVAAGLADPAKAHVAYAIGVARPCPCSSRRLAPRRSTVP